MPPEQKSDLMWSSGAAPPPGAHINPYPPLTMTVQGACSERPLFYWSIASPLCLVCIWIGNGLEVVNYRLGMFIGPCIVGMC